MRDPSLWQFVGVSALGCWLIATGACGLDWTIPDETVVPGPTGAGGQATTEAGTGAVAEGSGGSGGANGVSSAGGAGGASSSSTAAASSSSAGGAAPACDVGTCAACDECALAQDCVALFQACEDDPPCSPLAESCCVEVDACVYGVAESWQCMGNLSDTECIADCYEWIYYPPASIELHRQLMQCILCDACPTTCASYQQAPWLGGC